MATTSQLMRREVPAKPRRDGLSGALSTIATELPGGRWALLLSGPVNANALPTKTGLFAMSPGAKVLSVNRPLSRECWSWCGGPRRQAGPRSIDLVCYAEIQPAVAFQPKTF